MLGTSNGQRELPGWAQERAHRAVRFVIHPTDDPYRAEQQRVRQYQKARRRIVTAFDAIVLMTKSLSSIDAQRFAKSSVALGQLLEDWKVADERGASTKSVGGRPLSAVDRWKQFHSIVAELSQREGWPRAAANDALADFVVKQYPPVDAVGKRRNQHLYGELSIGYSPAEKTMSRDADRRHHLDARRDRERLWNETPIAQKAHRAFLGKLRSARITARSKRA